MRAVAQGYSAPGQGISRRVGLEERGQTLRFKALHSLHQRRGDAQQGLRGVDAGQQFLQPGWGCAQTCGLTRPDVETHADHGIACRAHGQGFNQDARQLALLKPNVVGPFELKRWVQAAGHAHPNGQRQARPVRHVQRHSNRKSQSGRARLLTEPASPQAATPGGL